MDLDLIVIQRSTYSALDLISEIGGVQAALMSYIIITLSLLDGNGL